MLRMNKLAGGVAASALALAMASAVHAQETTGAIRGQITNDAGEPVANATVVITHTPTGTRQTTVTGPDGYYGARGLRAGGPYTVAVTAPDMDEETATIPSIGIGEPADADITLYAVGTVETVVVTAQAVETSQGPSTRYTSEDISNLPSINRDLRDTVRNNPMVTIDTAQSGAIIVAGTNYRFNSFVVDGVKQNDDFGLNLAFPTQRSPINIDAVEAVSVDIAPYGVLNNDFQGAQINIVTKGGTNKFEGSLFGQKTDDSLIGDSIRGQPFNVIFKEENWGATLGGPIWRDRAFFFVSYEDFKGLRPLSIGIAGSGRSLQVPNTSAAILNAIESSLATTYNFAFDEENSLLDNPLSLEEADVKEQARIDLNITDDHRLRFTYQHTDGNRITEGLSSTSTRLALASNQYVVSDALKTWGLQLNSDWTDSFSTEIFYNDKDVLRGQIPVAGCADGPSGTGDEVCEFGQFTIAVAPGTDVVAGPDISRHANELENFTTTYGARAYLDLGAHELMIGAEREELEIFNIFGQRTEGDWEFNNLAQFQNRQASRLRYQNAVVDADGDGDRDENDLAAQFSINNTAFYAEDTWRVRDDLALTFGVRFEEFENPEDPVLNTFFQQRYGFANTSTLDGKNVFLPRFAFDWEAPWDLDVQGGVGLFSGGTPTVYISNSYSNTGVTGVLVDCNTSSTTGLPINTSTCSAAVAGQALTGVNGFDVPTVVENLLASPASFLALQRAAPTNALDPNFEVPQTWKTSITVGRDFDLTNYRLGDRWRLTADLMYTRVRYSPYLFDLRGGTTPRATAPDGRPIYNTTAQRAALIGATGTDQGNDLFLTNAEEGESTTFAVAVQKAFDNGLEFTLSQTFNDATDTQAFTSSTAGSNFSLSATRDPVNPEAATSNYEIAYSTKLTASWARAFFGDYETRITMFAEWRAGRPFSLTFRPVAINATTGGRTQDANVFGSTANNALFYVPRNADGTDPIVRYEDTRSGANVTQSASTTQFMLSQLYGSLGLSEYAGSVAPRNAFRSNDVTRIDARIQQELPAFFPRGARLKAYVDLQNIGNMLNDEWGVLEEVDFPYMPTVVDVRIDPATNQYVYSNFRSINTVTSSSFSPTRSVWQIAFGLRYEF